MIEKIRSIQSSNMNIDSNQSKVLAFEAISAIIEPGTAFELTALKIGGNEKRNASGWFTNPFAAATAAIQQESRQPEGVYITINPVHDGCRARSDGQISDACLYHTTNRDILRRNWVLFDIDPKRPTGVCATDGEIDSAAEAAEMLIDIFDRQFGLVDPLCGFSGNGIHIMYRVSMENDPENRKLSQIVPDCIAAANKLNTIDTIAIDRSVSNPCRLMKLWGTMSYKSSSQDRPRRRSFMITEPRPFVNFAINSMESLKALSARGAEERKKKQKAGGASRRKQKSSGTNPAQDLGQWLKENSIPVRTSSPSSGGGMRYILERCIFDPSHEGTSACFGVAASGVLYYKCHHDSCTSKGWREARIAVESMSGRRDGGPMDSPELGVLAADLESNPENPWALAMAYMDEQFVDHNSQQITIRRHRENVYRYNEKRYCYQPVSADCFIADLTCWLSGRVEKVTFRNAMDVAHCINSSINVPESFPPFWSSIKMDETMTGTLKQIDAARNDWISLKNGILDLQSYAESAGSVDCFFLHSPAWFNLISLPYDFNPAATCERWTAFLEQIFSGDAERIALIQEAFGYTLAHHCRFEKFFMFSGSGQNGKSTVLNVLRNLVGEENASSLDPAQIEDRYMLADIMGKLVNICGDMKRLDLIGEGIIKKICSGEPVTADRKYRSPITFAATTKLFFATNILPRFSDITLGLWRRMILVPFDYQVSDSEKDTGLPAKLAAEMSGIFNWSIQGLQRIHKQGGFTASSRCSDALENYRRECFPIMAFLEECTEAAPGRTVMAGDLWAAYFSWCKECGLVKPKPLHAFLHDVREFRRGFKSTGRRSGVRSGERFVIYDGLGLNLDRIIPADGLPESWTSDAKDKRESTASLWDGPNKQ